MKITKSYIAGIALLGAAIAGTDTATAKMSVKASVDSSQMVMGQQMAIKLDILDNASKPGQLVIDKEAFPKEVEVSIGSMATQPTSATGLWKCSARS